MTRKQATKQTYKMLSQVYTQVCKGQSQFWIDAYWSQYEYWLFMEKHG